MGQISIVTKGSFPTHEHIETAMEGGHAAALGRAIEYLSGMLPAAIEKDHRLHDDGVKPPDAPFGFKIGP